jgi:hypothetical protein
MSNFDLIKNPLRISSKNIDFGKTVVRPITAIVTTVIIVIAALYGFGVLKDVPCGEGVLKGLNRTFIHANWKHVAANLFAFLVLSRIEERYGSKFFGILIVQILVIATMIELVAFQFFDVPCSVGFSGVIFGLIAWELMNDRDVNITLFLGLAGMVVAPSLQNSKASLTGHAIGAVAGLLVAIYYKPKKD